MLGKYPMVHVETAPFDQSAHTCNGDPKCAASILSAYPTAKIPSLLEREPKVVEFLKLMSFTNDHMGAVLAWQDENSASYEGAAAYFLTNCHDTWSNSLRDEARGKLSALLK